ncbi:MAG TPA: GxxExxY protein, partial [Gemmatimonadaceae bacterium]
RMALSKFVFTRMTLMDTEKAQGTNAKTKLQHRELTGEILGGFFTVYNALGYGFLEHVYSNALSLELRNRGLKVEREVAVEVQYRGQPVGHYRMDTVVEGRVLVELKATAALSEADRRQLFNYQRASKVELGLLLHFGPKPAFRRYTFAPRKLDGSLAPSVSGSVQSV